MVIRNDDELNRAFHAFADGTRRRMVEMLGKRGVLSAGELGQEFAMSQPATSKHLKVLEAAKLIVRHIEGREHRFSLNVKTMNHMEVWVKKQREFWEGTLDSLARFIDEDN